MDPTLEMIQRKILCILQLEENNQPKVDIVDVIVEIFCFSVFKMDAYKDNLIPN